MKEIKEFVTQRYLHKPYENIHGDCWAACISTLTGISIEELPEVNDPQYSEWPSAQEAWDYFFPNDPYQEKHRGADDARMEAKIVYELYKLGIFRI